MAIFRHYGANFAVEGAIQRGRKVVEHRVHQGFRHNADRGRCRAEWGNRALQRIKNVGLPAIIAVCVAVLMVSSMTTATMVQADSAGLNTRDSLSFKVLRDGSQIGHHRIAFEQIGDELHVDVAVDLEVSLAFITLFRYEHRTKEVWRDGRLISLESQTNDDGEEYRVSARSTAEGLMVEGADGRFLAPAGILPTTYWHPDTVEQDTLLDTQHGRLLSVSSTPKGTDVIEAASAQLPAERFALEGDLEADLWYDPSGDWMKIAFSVRGSDIDYVPVGPHRGLTPQTQSTERYTQPIIAR